LLTQFEGTASALAVSPDRRHLAAASWGGDIRVFDQGQLLWERRQPPAVNDVLFSTSGRWLATAGEDRAVRLWASDTGSALAHVELPAEPVSLAIEPGGTLLASTGLEDNVRVWRVSRDGAVLEPVAVLAGDEARVSVPVFVPETDLVCAGDYAGVVRRWSLARPLRPEVIARHGGRVRAIVASEDGAIVASGGEDGIIWLVDFATGRARSLVGHRAGVRDLAFASGARLISASADGDIRVWSVAGAWSAVLRGHEAQVNRLSYAAPDRLLSSSGDGTVRVWSLPSQGAPANPGLELWLEARTTARLTGRSLLASPL
jgi:WD40 repeat protein